MRGEGGKLEGEEEQCTEICYSMALLTMQIEGGDPLVLMSDSASSTAMHTVKYT